MSNKKSIRFQINRLLCLCLALVLSVGLLDFLSIRANALTRDDAVAWARSQEGGGADVDGNGLWCTDLATAYINYCWLRANGDNRNPWGLYPYTTKNGREYDDYLNGNPNWTIINRTSTTVPQPGDLFVSERDSGGKGYGHVGIVLEPYGAGSARVIEMSGGVRPKISTVTWGSTASYNAEHFIRFNYFETHTHSYAQTVTKPTCTEGGYTTYTCSCGSSYRDNYTNALGHDIVYTVSKRPTTAEGGTLSGKCSRCGIGEASKTIPKLNKTNYIYEVERAATCTEDGLDRYTWKPSTYGRFSFDVVTPATGHSYVETVTAPTCKKQGYTTHTCTRCGDSFKDNETPALGHNYQKGVCTRCGAKDPKAPENRPFAFDDVRDQSAYYYDPVYWAYDHTPQITRGTSDTLFSPNAGCTRAQVVTFLWRAAGCPEPMRQDTGFADVKADAYYAKAVVWAIENGITNGTGSGKFSPDSVCTRAQIVTFLWRSKGSPKVGGKTVFDDVEAGIYYEMPVRWAVKMKITNGTSSTTFSPDNACTRGQVVTFLYRNSGGK